MWWRTLGVVVLLGAVGFAVGSGIGHAQRPATTAVDAVVPVPASSPAFPSDREIEVLPDPEDPPLEPALPAHYERVGSAPYTLRLPIPDGWARTTSNLGEWKWAPPRQSLNTYVLRVTYIGNRHLTIGGALSTRLEALDSAESTLDFQLESRTANTFVASYVSDNYRRLAMERFISVDGSDSAFATIAVIGRLTDRAGMLDLLERVTDGVQP